MDRKFKVLFLSSWYPNKVKPTHGNFVQKHAEAIASRGVDIAALHVCSDPNLKNKTYNIEITTINNVYTVNVYYRKVKKWVPIISQIIKLSRYITAHNKGYKIIKSRLSKINIVHHNILYPAGIFALILKWRCKIPFIVTENWTGYLPSKRSYGGLIRIMLSKLIARNASVITPVSKDLENALKSHGFKTRYIIVPNAVDTDIFYPSTSTIEKDKKQIVHVSTLDDPHKNISGILRVIKGLSKKRNDFEFHIITDGNPAPFIKYAKKLNIMNKYVFFEREKSYNEIADILRRSHFFVLFSNYENLPCVILESMACGLPVVSSTAGGTPEHISKDFGILVNPKDENALFLAVDNMLDNYQNYSSENIREYAIKNFSMDVVGKQFINIYNELM